MSRSARPSSWAPTPTRPDTYPGAFVPGAFRHPRTRHLRPPRAPLHDHHPRRPAPACLPSSSGTMAAITQRRYGPPQVLHLSTTPRPVPRPDEVLLAVRAAGVSRGVWHMMTGHPRLVRLVGGVRRPRRAIPGMDVCGHVVQVGSAVSSLQVGQRVFGIARGSFAEYAVAKAKHLSVAPEELTDREAAVLAESGLTALQALDAGGAGTSAEPGCRILVIGASGGVGSLAVALSALRGAFVTGVGSADKTGFVRDLGAQRVLDYRAVDPLAEGERYDVILDVAGGRKLSALRSALSPRGTLVFVGNESGGAWTGGYARPFAYQARMALRSQRFVNLLVRTDAADLARLADHARSDGLRPRIHATFPLREACKALEELSSGAAAGKIVVQLDPPELESLS